MQPAQSQCWLLAQYHEGDLLHVDIYDPFLIISYVDYHVVLPMGVGEAHPRSWDIGGISMPVSSDISATPPLYYIRASKSLLLPQSKELSPEDKAR